MRFSPRTSAVPTVRVRDSVGNPVSGALVTFTLPEGMTAEFKAKVDFNKMSWVVVGDAAKVKPQLEALGLPIEMQGEAAKPADTNAN